MTQNSSLEANIVAAKNSCSRNDEKLEPLEKMLGMREQSLHVLLPMQLHLQAVRSTLRIT
jgi:hypothetical protein